MSGEVCVDHTHTRPTRQSSQNERRIQKQWSIYRKYYHQITNIGNIHTVDDRILSTPDAAHSFSNDNLVAPAHVRARHVAISAGVFQAPLFLRTGQRVHVARRRCTRQDGEHVRALLKPWAEDGGLKLVPEVVRGERNRGCPEDPCWLLRSTTILYRKKSCGAPCKARRGNIGRLAGRPKAVSVNLFR